MVAATPAGVTFAPNVIGVLLILKLSPVAGVVNTPPVTTGQLVCHVVLLNVFPVTNPVS